MRARSTTPHIRSVLTALVMSTAGCLAIPSSRLEDTGPSLGPDGASPTDQFDDTASVLDAVWGVAGELAVVDGLLDLDNTSLQLATRVVACDVRARIDEAVPIAVTEGVEDVIQLWRFDVSTEGDGSCTFLGPTSVLLGIGPSSATLGPSAARAGYDASRAYGLLLGTVDQTPLLVGLAATAAQLDGTADLTDTAPLADGQYGLVTLHGVPLDD